MSTQSLMRRNNFVFDDENDFQDVSVIDSLKAVAQKISDEMDKQEYMAIALNANFDKQRADAEAVEKASKAGYVDDFTLKTKSTTSESFTSDYQRRSRLKDIKPKIAVMAAPAASLPPKKSNNSSSSLLYKGPSKAKQTLQHLTHLTMTILGGGRIF